MLNMRRALWKRALNLLTMHGRIAVNLSWSYLSFDRTPKPYICFVRGVIHWFVSLECFTVSGTRHQDTVDILVHGNPITNTSWTWRHRNRLCGDLCGPCAGGFFFIIWFLPLGRLKRCGGLFRCLL